MPYPKAEHADYVCQALRVDKELKLSLVYKELSTDGCNLLMYESMPERLRIFRR